MTSALPLAPSLLPGADDGGDGTAKVLVDGKELASAARKAGIGK